MSGVQAVCGSTPTAVPKNLDEITDEELLRQLWQEAENYSERRRIRARMYKLREKRLREMVQNDEESLGTLATTDQGSFKTEKSEAKITVTNPQRKASNIEVNLQVRGDSAVTDSVSMHNVKLGGLTMRGFSSRDTKRTSSDEEIIEEKVEATKKTRNDRFTKIMNKYEQTPADDAILSLSKSTYSVQNNALAGDSYESMKHKEVRDSVSPTRYDYRIRTKDTTREMATNKISAQDSDENSKSVRKQTSSYKNSQKESPNKVTARKISKELNTAPVTTPKISEKRKQNTDKVSTKLSSKTVRKPLSKETSLKNEYNKLDSYLNTCTDPNDELITEKEEVVEDESGNIVRMLIQNRRKTDGTEYTSRRIARTTKVVDSEKDINEILIGNPDHEIIKRKVEEKEESDGSKIKIISETRRRPDGIEYQTRNILKTSKIFDYDHPENVCYSESDELIESKELKEVDENGVEILTVTEVRRKDTGEKYTTKKVYKTSKVTSEISPSANDEVLERSETEETASDGVNVKVITERRKTQKGEEYTHRQVFKARKMTLSDIELLTGANYLKPSLASEDEVINREESDEIDEAGNSVKKVKELRKKKDGSQYSFDYVLRNIKGTEREISDIPYTVCESSDIITSINDELIKEDVKEEIQDDGTTVKTVIERRKTKDGIHYLRHRVIRIPKLPEPELQVASIDDELLEENINEDVLDDGTQFRAITERRRSSTTGIHYTLRRMSKVFHPATHLYGVDEIIDENVTEEETSDGVLTRTVVRRYQRSDDSVYTTHNVSKIYKNPIYVIPDECSNDELVDRSYDLRETHDGFLIRTVMETRCRTDGVHYTVERTEKISKSKSGLKSTNAENGSLLTGSPGDIVVSREQHEEPGDAGIIIKTVLEVRRRNDGTEYTNKATVRTTQILVPQHETSYVIIKPDPRNACGKDFMPSLNDEIIYTRNKEEIDDQGNAITVIIETRKSSVTGEKYNLTKRVKITDVVITDHGEKVLSKPKLREKDVSKSLNLFSKNSNKHIGKPVTETSPNKAVEKIVSDKKRKGDTRHTLKSTKTSYTPKSKITDGEIISSTIEECKPASVYHKVKDTKKAGISNNISKERNVRTDSNSKSRRSDVKTSTSRNSTAKVDVANKVSSIKHKSSGSSSETRSESYSPDRSNVPGKYSPSSKKDTTKLASSEEGIALSTKSISIDRTDKKETNELKEVSKFHKVKSSIGEEKTDNCKKVITTLRSSDEENSKQKELKIKKSTTGPKFEKKTPPREINYTKSNSYAATPSPVHVKSSMHKRDSLAGDTVPMTSKSTNEKTLNYMNVVKKRNNVKDTAEKTEDQSTKLDSTRSTNKTSAIRDKYCKSSSSDTNSISSKNMYLKVEKSLLSQIIPDTPKLNVAKKAETHSVSAAADRIVDNVSSKRSLFEKYSDVKNIDISPSTKERTPVIEPVIIPRHIEPMCKNDRSPSVDLTIMKSKDLNLASTKLVRDSMHPETKPVHQDLLPTDGKVDLLESEVGAKHHSSVSEDTTDHASEMKIKKMSTSSVDSFSYQRRDSDGSFTKEYSPSRFTTGKPIDHGVNTNKIKRLERASSNKKLLEDLETPFASSFPLAQKLECITNVTELENMLNRAESYEERRIIRGRIRTVKRELQNQQSNRVDKSVAEKYSFKSPSNLSPQIQRRSAQLTGKSTDTQRMYGKEDKHNVTSTKHATLSSKVTKSSSSTSKYMLESNKNEVEQRKISASSVKSTDDKSLLNVERRKSSTSSSVDKIRKYSTEDTFGRGHRSEGETITEEKSSSDSFVCSKSNFELASKIESSLREKRCFEEVEEIAGEDTKIKAVGKSQSYMEPLRHQKLKTNLAEKHQTDVEKVISPYGVGPTDENGVPLFGLKALKRRNKPEDIQIGETSKAETKAFQTTVIAGRTIAKKKVSIEEHEECIDSKFETDSLNMDPDSLSEGENDEQNVRSKNFRNIVLLHESKVTDPSLIAESSPPPRQKLRSDFFEKADQKSYKTWDLETDLVTRSDAVENIIAKHETLTTTEPQKVEKRLTGILKKTSSIKASKNTNVKETIARDIEEETTQKIKSEMSSDFCATKKLERKSSITEVDSSSQLKASKKKKNLGRIDSTTTQTTNKSLTKKGKLSELLDIHSKISTKEDMQQLSIERKISDKTAKKPKIKKHSNTKETKSDTSKTINESDGLKINTKTKNNRHRTTKKKSLIEKKSNTNAICVDTCKIEVKTKKQLKPLKQTGSSKSDVINKETHTATASKTQTSLENNKKQARSTEKKISSKDSSLKEVVQKDVKKGNKTKTLKVSSNLKVTNKENEAIKENDRKERKRKVKASYVCTADMSQKRALISTTKGKYSKTEVKKEATNEELVSSGKLIASIKHESKNNIIAEHSPTLRSNNSKYRQKDSSTQRKANTNIREFRAGTRSNIDNIKSTKSKSTKLKTLVTEDEISIDKVLRDSKNEKFDTVDAKHLVTHVIEKINKKTRKKDNTSKNVETTSASTSINVQKINETGYTNSNKRLKESIVAPSARQIIETTNVLDTDFHDDKKLRNSTVKDELPSCHSNEIVKTKNLHERGNIIVSSSPIVPSKTTTGSKQLSSSENKITATGIKQLSSSGNVSSQAMTTGTKQLSSGENVSPQTMISGTKQLTAGENVFSTTVTTGKKQLSSSGIASSKTLATGTTKQLSSTDFASSRRLATGTKQLSSSEMVSSKTVDTGTKELSSTEDVSSSQTKAAVTKQLTTSENVSSKIVATGIKHLSSSEIASSKILATGIRQVSSGEMVSSKSRDTGTKQLSSTENVSSQTKATGTKQLTASENVFSKTVDTGIRQLPSSDIVSSKTLTTGTKQLSSSDISSYKTLATGTKELSSSENISSKTVGSGRKQLSSTDIASYETVDTGAKQLPSGGITSSKRLTTGTKQVSSSEMVTSKSMDTETKQLFSTDIASYKTKTMDTGTKQLSSRDIASSRRLNTGTKQLSSSEMVSSKSMDTETKQLLSSTENFSSQTKGSGTKQLTTSENVSSKIVATGIKQLSSSDIASSKTLCTGTKQLSSSENVSSKIVATGTKQLSSSKISSSKILATGTKQVSSGEIVSSMDTGTKQLSSTENVSSQTKATGTKQLAASENISSKTVTTGIKQLSSSDIASSKTLDTGTKQLSSSDNISSKTVGNGIKQLSSTDIASYETVDTGENQLSSDGITSSKRLTTGAKQVSSREMVCSKSMDTGTKQLSSTENVSSKTMATGIKQLSSSDIAFSKRVATGIKQLSSSDITSSKTVATGIKQLSSSDIASSKTLTTGTKQLSSSDIYSSKILDTGTKQLSSSENISSKTVATGTKQLSSSDITSSKTLTTGTKQLSSSDISASKTLATATKQLSSSKNISSKTVTTGTKQLSSSEKVSYQTMASRTKHLSSHDSAKKTELFTSNKNKSENNGFPTINDSTQQVGSKKSVDIYSTSIRADKKKNTKKLQSDMEKTSHTVKSEKINTTRDSKKLKNCESPNKISSILWESNDTKAESDDNPNKNGSKGMPHYMLPKSTNRRRRSTPEKDPEELENILLNSYIYTRCTKRISLPSVSYDYTYVINNDSKTAGTNGDSYSVYFGPRDKAPLSDVSKRSSIASDTFSITEEGVITARIVEGDVEAACRDITLPERKSSITSERKLSNEVEDFSETNEQSFEAIRNTELHSKENSRIDMHMDEMSSHQDGIEVSNLSGQQATFLTVPEVQPTKSDPRIQKQTDKYLSSTEKNLQNKYYYQVERKNTENIGLHENQNKEIKLSPTTTEKSTNITDKFDVDFTNVYADKMAQYYKSSAKKEEQVMDISEKTHDMYAERKSEEYHYEAHSTETKKQNESDYFTFDGRLVITKPLSGHLIESSTQELPVTVYPTDDKEIIELTTRNEESTSEREYTKKYDIPTASEIEKNSEMTDEKSFLNDRTKVTGINDVLSRMGATEAVDHEAKVTSDDQAISLLNRFIGAQVLMTGVESMMAQSTSSQNRAPPTFGQGKTTVVSSNVKPTSSSVQQSAPDIIQGVNINDVDDSFELNELLDSCEGYDERRRIRLRLKDVVAQEKASGDIIGLKKVTSTRRIVGSKVATVGSSEGKGVSAFNKFKQIDDQQSRTTSGPHAGGPLFALSTSLNRSASGVKDMIMTWCKGRTRNYKGVKIENFSTSWNDGLAFCALIHHFYPDAFNFDSLNPQNRRYNFALAFRTADERAGVYPLLDVEDMVVMKKPDWKCVFTYVQTLYKRLKDE